MVGQYIEPMPWPRPHLLEALAARWPGRCAVCHDWARGGLCEACFTRFAAPVPRCVTCALPLPSAAMTVCSACRQQPPPFARAMAAVDYRFPWDGLITRFKFHGQPELARPLTQLLLRQLSAGPAALADLVLPVPLGDARLAERGYNQAWELARRLARALRLTADAHALARWRDTGHQVGLDRAERRRNLADAFVVPPSARARLHGQRIALVDDVVTTGATASAAAHTLLAAGAADVQLWMVARTPPPDD